jgi:hypothetical protein
MPREVSQNIISDNKATGGGAGLYAGNFLNTFINNPLVRNQANTDSAAHLFMPENYSYNLIIGNIVTSSSLNSTLGIDVTSSRGIGISYNNISGNSASCELYNGSNECSPDLIAQNNWWGTAEQEEIANRIYDFFEDNTRGVVNFLPYANAIRTDVPISSPLNLKVTRGQTGAGLNWSANPKSDVAGYKTSGDRPPDIPTPTRGTWAT